MKSYSGYIAIAGRPNVGKSSLLNAIIGESLAPVTAKAQTTRKKFLGIHNEKFEGSQYQLIFVDMPGIHVPKQHELLNQFCVEEAGRALDDADVYVYMIDLSRDFLVSQKGSDELAVISMIEKRRKKNNTPLIVVMNKLDIVPVSNRAAIMESIQASLKEYNVDHFFSMSIKNNLGLLEFKKYLLRSMKEHPPYYPCDIISNEPMRVIVQEKIQEQLFQKLGEEIPYDCAVEILSYSDPRPPLKKTEIQANIHIARSSLKQIIIGNSGKKIKEIGQSARIELEKLIGNGVVLKLFVKENKNWSKNKKAMQALGYEWSEKK